jgi:hypothetical protein
MNKTRIISLLLIPIFLASCANLQALQANPGVQAAETAAIGIGLNVATGSPAFSWVAPIAVNGLTALAGNPKAVTGIVAQDAPLIVSTIKAAIPNSAGTKAATAIAQAYTTAMAAPGVPQTTTGANAVISAIASGLTSAASASPGASAKEVRASTATARWQRELRRGQIDRDDYAGLVRGERDLHFAVDNEQPLSIRP